MESRARTFFLFYDMNELCPNEVQFRDRKLSVNVFIIKKLANVAGFKFSCGRRNSLDEKPLLIFDAIARGSVFLGLHWVLHVVMNEDPDFAKYVMPQDPNVMNLDSLNRSKTSISIYIYFKYFYTILQTWRQFTLQIIRWPKNELRFLRIRIFIYRTTSSLSFVRRSRVQARKRENNAQRVSPFGVTEAEGVVTHHSQRKQRQIRGQLHGRETGTEVGDENEENVKLSRRIVVVVVSNIATLWSLSSALLTSSLFLSLFLSPSLSRTTATSRVAAAPCCFTRYRFVTERINSRRRYQPTEKHDPWNRESCCPCRHHETSLRYLQREQAFHRACATAHGAITFYGGGGGGRCV